MTKYTQFINVRQVPDSLSRNIFATRVAEYD